LGEIQEFIEKAVPIGSIKCDAQLQSKYSPLRRH